MIYIVLRSNPPRQNGGADIEVFAIVFLMSGQKCYGVFFIDNTLML